MCPTEGQEKENRKCTRTQSSDYLEMFTTYVRSVEPDQIRQTGNYWNPEDATLVVVGNTQKIQKSLEKYGTVQVARPKY